MPSRKRLRYLSLKSWLLSRSFALLLTAIVLPSMAKTFGQEPNRLAIDGRAVAALKKAPEGEREHLISANNGHSASPRPVFQAGTWDAKPNQYLVLQRKYGHQNKETALPVLPPVLHQRPVQPYAYGWFGATMNRHPKRSFGFHKNHTQWSFE